MIYKIVDLDLTDEYRYFGQVGFDEWSNAEDLAMTMDCESHDPYRCLYAFKDFPLLHITWNKEDYTSEIQDADDLWEWVEKIPEEEWINFAQLKMLLDVKGFIPFEYPDKYSWDDKEQESKFKRLGFRNVTTTRIANTGIAEIDNN